MTWWQSLLIALIPALITAVISGLFSYFSAIKKAEKSIDELSKKHKQEMEKLQVQHKLEMEKMQQQQEYEKKLKEQEFGMKIGESIVSPLLNGIMGSDVMKQEVAKMIKEKFQNKEDNKDAD